jgi:phospholipid-transporting ATPase
MLIGAVLYTGHDSKLMQNSTAAPIKRSRMDRITNVQILLLFLLLLVLALISASIGTSWIDANKKKLWYLASADLSTPNFFLEFLTFIIVYNNLIPISLIVTIEFVKFIQAYLMNLDLDMYYAPRNTPAMARTSNINEELGQVIYKPTVG